MSRMRCGRGILTFEAAAQASCLASEDQPAESKSVDPGFAPLIRHQISKSLVDHRSARLFSFWAPGEQLQETTHLEFELMPCRILRTDPATKTDAAFEHAKPAIHIEHAQVVAPEGEEAWTDPLNRIRVRHAWDRQSPSGAFNTSPLLLALQADTGNAYGAVHVPRAGEWVAIGHWGGDCDRPFVLGRLNGGSMQRWQSDSYPVAHPI